MGFVLRDTLRLINDVGHRFVLTGGGDSTFNRGNGFGEWGGFLTAMQQFTAFVGALGGMNVSASGQQALYAGKRQTLTAVGVTTAPADPECLGGVVCPSGWAGFQHCLLAAAGTTISTSNWCWLSNASMVNAHGRVVASMFSRAVSGATDANTGYQPVICGGDALDSSAFVNGTRQAAGTRVNTSAAPVGTLRRVDMESEQVTATAALGIGATFGIGDAGLRLGGPGLFLYAALTAKDTPRGVYASKHLSQGGRSLHAYIRDHLNTASMMDSVETYFKCMLMLRDTTYASSYGGCQGDVTPGGLGGADLPVGCLWVDCFLHNDVGSDANTSSFVPAGQESWAAEATVFVESHNTGAGTVNVTAGQGALLDASGHLHLPSGEIITYTGKSGDQLTGCVFAAYGTIGGQRNDSMAYQGYLGITPTGAAANNLFWDQWLRARWAAAGGDPNLFRRVLKAPFPSSDTLEVVSGVATATLAQREQRHREMIAAIKVRSTSSLFEVVDPREIITAQDMVQNRWCDVSLAVTLTGSGVTSTVGDTISVGAGLSTTGVGRIGNEAFKWTGKSGNNPTGCTRGAFGTTAYDNATPSHQAGREVVECDMIHSSTRGYFEFWRRWLQRELGASGVGWQRLRSQRSAA